VLPLKDLRGRSVGEKATAWDGRILKKLEGPRGPSRLWVNGRAWFAGHAPLRQGLNLRSPGYGGQAEELCRFNEPIISICGTVCQGLLVSGLSAVDSGVSVKLRREIRKEVIFLANNPKACGTLQGVRGDQQNSRDGDEGRKRRNLGVPGMSHASFQN